MTILDRVLPRAAVRREYVKALLVAHSVPFPKAHDIGELMRLLPSSATIPLSVDENELLTFYATTVRYPGDYEPVSLDHAENAAVSVARRVRGAVQDQLPQAI